MNELDKALAILRPLTNVGDRRGIIVAEKAIDAALAGTQLVKRLDLLKALRVAITPTGKGGRTDQVTFAETLLALVDNRIESLRDKE